MATGATEYMSDHTGIVNLIPDLSLTAYIADLFNSNHLETSSRLLQLMHKIVF